MLRIRNAFLRLQDLWSDRKQKIDTASRERFEKAAQNGPTETRLAKLEDWYRKCLEDPAYRDDTLYNEIINEEEIERDIKELVPSIKQGLRDEYCRACCAFPEKWSRIRKQQSLAITHLSSIRELKAGSNAGCRLCRLFFQDINPTDLRQFYKFEKRLQLFGVPTILLLKKGNYKDRIGLGYSNILVWQFRWILGGPYGLAAYPIEKPETFSSGLSQRPEGTSLDKAKQWLTACTQDHPLCKVTASIRLPTRLLFLNSQNVSGGQNLTVRLVETANWDNGVQYATLSHCWGKINFLKLTVQTLDSFKISIPLHLLTQTFQDAIKVTLYLGLQYLWIHSLCIIQDFKSDWEVEAGLMASVYGGSYINIAATDAKDGTEGLFLKALDFIGVYMSPSSPNIPTYAIASENFYRDAIPGGHLASRAWTFQERHLSHRTLHFSSTDLFWECRSTNACGSFPDGIPGNFLGFALNRQVPWLEIWPHIILLYSHCYLTFDSDKLVALAGIARAAQQESGDEYIAGMWRTRMEEWLLWVCEGPGRRTQSTVYRAPTWSWASVDDVVYYDDSIVDPRNLELLSNVLDVAVLPTGQDLFGHLSGGVLTLGCPGMRSAEASEVGGKMDSVRFPGVRKDVAMKEECPTSDGNVKWVPIISKGSESGGAIYGLILRSTGAKKGEFERIGMFSERIGEPSWQEATLRATVREFGPDIARECCAEIRINPESGKEQYVITIV